MNTKLQKKVNTLFSDEYSNVIPAEPRDKSWGRAHWSPRLCLWKNSKCSLWNFGTTWKFTANLRSCWRATPMIALVGLVSRERRPKITGCLLIKIYKKKTGTGYFRSPGTGDRANECYQWAVPLTLIQDLPDLDFEYILVGMQDEYFLLESSVLYSFR